ncbi:hypothetical protein EXIGLDRAFT_780314 [Exidia glandulosa HHB12029]|uniref:Uncharacterized protein n=1 Tax=Exidia glandulosa HHB12029 TaxID=1314781 RepID=A0A165BNK8_EXIGL|nr:hypothetical protein EXIGLDRAFT_780314 [Exidia glandulosa HHB12029]
MRLNLHWQVLLVAIAGATAVDISPEFDFMSPQARGWLLSQGWDGHSPITEGEFGTSVARGADRRDIHRLADPGVFLTMNINFGGKQQYIPNVPGDSGDERFCFDVPAGLQGQVSSVGLDRGIKCFAYTGRPCDTRSPMYGPLTFPGVDNVAQWNNAQFISNTSEGHVSQWNVSEWNAQISVFDCVFSRTSCAATLYFGS